MNWTCTICSEWCGSANFQNFTVRIHNPSAHQPSLSARCRTHLLQTGSYDVSIHPRHLSVYLQSCFTRVSDVTSRRRLRSSASHGLEVPPVRLFTVGMRAFPVSGATVWNDLPLHVASAPSLAVFRQRLKQDTIIWFMCLLLPSITILSGYLWSLK